MQQKAISARLREFEKLCRQRGLPVTMQRRVILEAVLERDDHPTAEQIHEAVQKQIPQLSRTTIYRVLDALVDFGLIRRLHQTGAVRFDGKIVRHHHLVCVHCGKIMDLADRSLDELPLPKHKFQGFKIEDFSVQFSGTCPDCQKEKE